MIEPLGSETRLRRARRSWRQRTRDAPHLLCAYIHIWKAKTASANFLALSGESGHSAPGQGGQESWVGGNK